MDISNKHKFKVFLIHGKRLDPYALTAEGRVIAGFQSIGFAERKIDKYLKDPESVGGTLTKYQNRYNIDPEAIELLDSDDNLEELFNRFQLYYLLNEG
ncbi:hypothetical protein PYDG_00005 [Pseudoalteromonas phage pYD6-A]|uniref:Uncharacterized protein n=1 Tax=Pseudoalteromonas phage pYD6-A TaxID=754052 RepID=M4SME5_9CAUD|nr:hypothetical protein PYDG_00005 [Pseudoalteromonas phage pYD6-A]AGH57537.1 hypothetical protein PYDG_00005 [Pseudoalteromonas phage pYD6-A]